MLREQTNPPTESEKEQEAIAIESRRSAAENDIVILGDAKKKLQTDIDANTEDIKLQKEFISENEAKILQLKNEVLDVQNVIKKEKQILEDFIKDKNSEKSAIEDVLTIKKNKVAALDVDISDLSKKHESNKTSHADEISALEEKKGAIVKEITALEEKERNINADIKTKQDSIPALQEELKKILDQKKIEEENVTKLKSYISDLQVSSDKINLELGSYDKIIEDKKSQITVFDTDIIKKKEEYKNLEQKAFSILNRAQALDSREAYIKSQYERAGIPWEEIK